MRDVLTVPRRTVRRPRPEEWTGDSHPATELLRLQRAAGNQAVQRLVGAGCCAACARGGPCTSERDELAPAARAVVQRLAQPAEPDIDTDEIEGIGAAGVVVQRQDAGAPAVPGAACAVFADLTGFPRRNRGRRAFAALTAFRFALRGGRFRATWNRGGSWVNTFQVPITGARTPRTADMVRQCRRAFRRGSPSFTTNPAGNCPAAAAGVHTANTAAECDTVVGRGLHADDVADLPRLAEHEQYHLKLACVLADLANAALAGGRSARQVGRQLANAGRRETRRYDRETRHGCDAGTQAAWQADLDAGIATFP
jgi:hypothetical protein